jgi:amino acid transporter
MTERPRDAGLVRAVGPWALVASIISMLIGAGIFAVPSALAGAAGRYAPLAFLVCSLAIGSVAICLAEGGSRIPTSGGIYGYVEAAFGPGAGYVAGTMLWVGDVLACGGVAAALADVVMNALPHSMGAIARPLVIIAVVGGIALVNLRGVAHGARLVGVATTIKLFPLVIFVLVGAGAMHGANFTQMATPNTDGFGRAVILATFTLMGMETALAASGEVSSPSRNIPRALAIALGSTSLLYIAIQVVAQGILGPSLAHSTVPLADAMAHVSPLLRLLMLAAAAVSMFGWIGSDILGTSRVLFAFARDGRLPRVLGLVHQRTHVPYVAILVYAAMAIVLALSSSFAELAVVSTLTSGVLYPLGCCASWLLARHGVAQAGTPLNFRWLGAATVLSVISMIVLVALASRQEIIGLAVLVGLSVLAYAATEAGRRARVSTP